MITTLWSHKAGSGVSTVASALACEIARTGQRVVLVDLGGDVPSILGVSPPVAGIGQVLALATDPTAEFVSAAPLADGSLGGGPINGVMDRIAPLTRTRSIGIGRLEVEVRPGLSLLGLGLNSPTNRNEWSASSVADLFGWLRSESRQVIVDFGGTLDGAAGLRTFLNQVDHSVVVTRLCGISMARWGQSQPRPTGVVVIREPGRCWRPSDVTTLMRAPLVGLVDVDPAVSRAIDRAELDRTPLRFRRAVRQLAEAVT